MLLHWRNTVLKTENISKVYEYFLGLIKANNTFLNEFLKKKVDFIGIAEDSRDIVLADVYGKMNNYNFSNLTVEYAKNTIELIKNRIMKSGLQMAKILNDIFDERAKNKANPWNLPSFFLLILASVFYFL